MELKKEIFSTSFRAGKRTYIVDVRVSSKQEKYVVITERIADRDRGIIMVFEEYIADFRNALNQALGYFEK